MRGKYIHYLLKGNGLRKRFLYFKWWVLQARPNQPQHRTQWMKAIPLGLAHMVSIIRNTWLILYLNMTGFIFQTNIYLLFLFYFLSHNPSETTYSFPPSPSHAFYTESDTFSSACQTGSSKSNSDFSSPTILSPRRVYCSVFTCGESGVSSTSTPAILTSAILNSGLNNWRCISRVQSLIPLCNSI